MLKYVYIVLGTVSLALGIMGFVVPGLPKTPFILLTAFLYAKSSPRLHKKLVEHRITGPYINKVNNGLSLQATLISIAFMWAMISFTMFVVFKGNSKMQMLMVGLGLIGTVAQYIVLRKRKPQKKLETENNPSDNENDVLE